MARKTRARSADWRATPMGDCARSLSRSLLPFRNPAPPPSPPSPQPPSLLAKLPPPIPLGRATPAWLVPNWAHARSMGLARRPAQSYLAERAREGQTLLHSNACSACSLRALAGAFRPSLGLNLARSKTMHHRWGPATLLHAMWRRQGTVGTCAGLLADFLACCSLGT